MSNIAIKKEYLQSIKERFYTYGILLRKTESVCSKEDREYILRLKNILRLYKADPYYKAIELKFFKGRTDVAVAAILHCDASTVRRNLKRLLSCYALHFYGAECMERLELPAIGQVGLASVGKTAKLQSCQKPKSIER